MNIHPSHGISFAKNPAFFEAPTARKVRFCYYVNGTQVSRWRFAQLLVTVRRLGLAGDEFSVKPRLNCVGHPKNDIHYYKSRKRRRVERVALREFYRTGI